MNEADYEILPHKLLSDLRYDVEALKKKLTQPDAKAEELILEIESLKESIHELTTIFQRALEELKSENLTKVILEKLIKIEKQNEMVIFNQKSFSEKALESGDYSSGVMRASISTPLAKGKVTSRPFPYADITPPQPQMELRPPLPPSQKKRTFGNTFE